MERFDVVVAGLGGMGASAAFHLAARGLSVLGLERHGLPHELGSSHGETRVIRKAYFEDPRYVPLLHRAYELWAALEEDCGEPLYVRAGCLTAGPADHPAILGVQRSVDAHALPHARLSARELRARFPAFVPNDGDVGVHEEDAGFLWVERCTLAHANGARRRGATLRCPARVIAVRPSNDHVEVDVETETNERTTVRARRLVLAAGPWLPHDEAFAPLVRGMPLVVQRQAQLWFSPHANGHGVGTLPCFVHFSARGAFYGIPSPSPGRPVKVCRHHGGAATTAETVSRAIEDDDVEDVRGFLRDHLPGLETNAARARVCLYTSTPDEHFVVGALPASPAVILLSPCSGHGFKMASVIGEIAADLVVDGRSRFDLGMFSPSRFG